MTTPAATAKPAARKMGGTGRVTGKHGPATGEKTGKTTAAPSAAGASPEAVTPDLRKKELIDLVVERSGLKKKDVKPAIEATLATLAEIIAEGREFNLPPLGKLRINRTQDKPNARVTVCKLRQAKAGSKPANDPLAEAAE